MIITAQLPIKDWHAYLGNETIADAMMDRLIHTAHKLELRGGSMREYLAKKIKTFGHLCYNSGKCLCVCVPKFIRLNNMKLDIPIAKFFWRMNIKYPTFYLIVLKSRDLFFR